MSSSDVRFCFSKSCHIPQTPYSSYPPPPPPQTVAFEALAVCHTVKKLGSTGALVGNQAPAAGGGFVGDQVFETLQRSLTADHLTL